jgi:RNA polymerase sigma factor (sigma-70 family)
MVMASSGSGPNGPEGGQSRRSTPDHDVGGSRVSSRSGLGDQPLTSSMHPDPDCHVPDPTKPSADVVAEFTKFYKAAMPRLVAFLRWQGASLPDAADCAQESLAACFEQWSTIERHYAWCRTTATRGYARRLATIREHPVDDLNAVGSPLLSPVTDIDALEYRHTVLALLERLPLRQRQVLAWTYDGATTTEIAKSLQISPDAVRSNLRHARTTLRACRGEFE